MKSARETAFQIIYKVLEEGEYSHLVIADALKLEADADKRDRAFVTRISEGTLEHLLTLDYVTDRVSKTPVKKMKPVIRTILRMSVYQLMYMDSVPDSAVCNEAVKLAKAKGFHGLSGFVNGVLRSVARMNGAWKEESFYPDKKKHPVQYFCVRYSMPEWLCEYFLKEYGEEVTEKILEGSQRNPKTTIRCNQSRISAEELEQRLRGYGYEVEKGVYAKGARYLSGYDTLEKIPEFSEGLFQVQDESSMLVAELAGLKAGDLVLDVCSAPGGKALHAANLLNELGGGQVVARDVSRKKTALIEENAKRLSADNISVQVFDATVLDERMVEKADVVIADLPCSGLGVLGKKPDIRYRIREEDLNSLVTLQRDILSTVWQYVKPGGTLMYSTCTLNKAENEENVMWFTDSFPFVLENEADMVTIFPDELFDGFFIAKLKRTK